MKKGKTPKKPAVKKPAKKAAKRPVKKKGPGKPSVKKKPGKLAMKKPQPPSPPAAEDKAIEARIDQKTIEDFIFGSGTVLTAPQKKLFITTALRSNLDPFKREVHPVPFEDKWLDEKTKRWESYDPKRYRLAVITGYEVYLRRGENSGKLEHWKVWTEYDTAAKDIKACIDIKRKDFKEPFYIEIWLTEYRKDNAIWRKMPRSMLEKVAIARGFRFAFPNETAGLTYTREEYDPEADMKNVSPGETPAAIPQPTVKKELPAGDDKKKEKKYQLPEDILPDTKCTIGSYEKNPIPYGEVPLDHLIMLYNKSENPKELDGVISWNIEGLVVKIVEKIKYTNEQYSNFLKTNYEVESVMELDWRGKLKVLRNLQNILRKKEAGNGETQS